MHVVDADLGHQLRGLDRVGAGEAADHADAARLQLGAHIVADCRSAADDVDGADAALLHRVQRLGGDAVLALGQEDRHVVGVADRSRSERIPVAVVRAHERRVGPGADLATLVEDLTSCAGCSVTSAADHGRLTTGRSLGLVLDGLGHGSGTAADDDLRRLELLDEALRLRRE